MPRARTPGASPSSRSTGSLVLLLLFARVGAAVMSAAIGLVVPRALGRGDSASYGIVVGIALMFVVLTDLGLTTSTARALAEGRVDAALWRRIALLRAAAAGAGATLFFVVALLMNAGVPVLGGSRHSMPPSLVLAGGGLILAASMSGVAAGLLPTLRRVNMLLVVTLVQPMLEFGGVVLALLAGAGATGIVLASTGAALIAGTIGVAAVARGIQRREAPGEDQADLAAIRAYGWPMFLVAISFTAFGLVDQLVLYIMRGGTYASTYIWSWRLVTLLHVPGLAAATIVAPRLASAARPGADEAELAAARRNLFAGWLRLLTVTYVGVAAIAASMAPWLVPAALGHRYAADWRVFSSLALYAGLLGIAPLVTMSANFLGGAAIRVRLGLVTIVLNAALDLALVPRFGYRGAAFGTSVAFSWYVVAHAVLTWRLLGGTIVRRGARPSDSDSDSASPTRAITRLRVSAPLAMVTIAAAALCALGANVAASQLDGSIGAIASLLVAGCAFASLYGAIVLGFSYLTKIDLVSVARSTDDIDDDDVEPPVITASVDASDAERGVA